MNVERNEGRAKSLKVAMDQLHKQFGAGVVMRMGARPSMKVEAIPTGSLGLDKALGIGGLPRGRAVEVFGPESSGKTTLTLAAIASAQAAGGTAAFVDAEHALDPSWAATIGVDVDNLIISQPDNGEQALEVTEKLVRSGAVDIVVVDSVAALTPKAEIEGDMGGSLPGLQARLMSQAMRKLVGAISDSKCLVIFVNQIRHKIGVMYGSPETTTGGNALKFYASVRIDIRRAEAIKHGEEIVGHTAKVKVLKNKIAPPFKQAMVPIYYDRGFCTASEALAHGVDAGVIEKSGAWYAMDGAKIGQGQQNSIEWLRANPEKLAELVQKIRQVWSGGNDTTAMAPAEAEAAAIEATS